MRVSRDALAARARRDHGGSRARGTPRDGRRTILAGYLEPTGPVLRGPLSGRERVAYTFEIYEMKRVGKSTSKLVYADGIALTPTMIVTRTDRFICRRFLTSIARIAISSALKRRRARES
jgi:hypothetical protein